MRIIMLSPDAQMIDRRILQEASSLQRLGHRVTVLSGFECAKPDAYEQDDGVVVERFAFDWVDLRKVALLKRLPLIGRLTWPIVRVASKIFGLPSAFETFVASKVLAHEFDVVHVHDFPLLRAAARIAKERDVPLVYDSHEFYPIQSIFTLKQQRRFLARERALFRVCRRVITVNPYIAKMMARTHDAPEPLVILNASPMPPASQLAIRTDFAAKRTARIAHRLPPDAFIFVYQGWISSERNLESMIEAVKSVREPAMLLIIGYGEHVENLKALANDLGVSDRIIFYGRVESDSLGAITELCDVGIIPYVAVDEMHRYCSPNKLFEFVAAEIPVIASDLPYLRDVVDGYKIGWLCDTGSPAALARVMNEALNKQAQFGPLRDQLRVALTRLNWSVEEQKLFSLYAEIECETNSSQAIGAQAVSNLSRTLPQ